MMEALIASILLALSHSIVSSCNTNVLRNPKFVCDEPEMDIGGKSLESFVDGGSVIEGGAKIIDTDGSSLKSDNPSFDSDCESLADPTNKGEVVKTHSDNPSLDSPQFRLNIHIGQFIINETVLDHHGHTNSDPALDANAKLNKQIYTSTKVKKMIKKWKVPLLKNKRNGTQALSGNLNASINIPIAYATSNKEGGDDAIIIRGDGLSNKTHLDYPKSNEAHSRSKGTFFIRNVGDDLAHKTSNEIDIFNKVDIFNNTDDSGIDIDRSRDLLLDAIQLNSYKKLPASMCEANKESTQMINDIVRDVMKKYKTNLTPKMLGLRRDSKQINQCLCGQNGRPQEELELKNISWDKLLRSRSIRDRCSNKRINSPNYNNRDIRPNYDIRYVSPGYKNTDHKFIATQDKEKIKQIIIDRVVSLINARHMKYKGHS